MNIINLDSRVYTHTHTHTYRYFVSLLRFTQHSDKSNVSIKPSSIVESLQSAEMPFITRTSYNSRQVKYQEVMLDLKKKKRKEQ